MIDPDAPDEVKLSTARKLYDETLQVYADFFTEATEDVAFESGDQWNKEDREHLQSELRPALTFNLLQSIIDHNIGTIEDAKKAPRVVAVSRNDRFLADVLNDLHDRVREEIDISMDEMEAAHWSAISGIGGVALDANEDEDVDDYIQITLTPLPYDEFKFDPLARKSDLSDAAFVLRDRWLNEAEFKRTYPKHWDAWERLLAAPQEATVLGTQTEAREPRSATDDFTPLEEWGINRQKREVRVVHLEYRTSVKVRRARPLAAGAGEMFLTEAEAAFAEQDEEFRLGYELDPKGRVKTQIRWLEFAGAKEILFDDEAPLPISGFSIVPFVWRRDRRKNTFAGKIRSLKDPQREVNKRFSQEVHLVNSMAQPGTDAEINALAQPRDEFQRAGMTPGGLRLIQDGKLASVRDRPMPQVPDAAARLHDNAIQLIRVISNTTMDTLLEPRGVPEAAATAQLRHRQSTLAMVPVLRNYQAFQRTLAKRIIELIVNLFSDRQIADMLSNADQFKVVNGVIQEAGGENRVAKMRDVRDLRYNVSLVTTAETENSNQLVQLQFLDTAREREIPIAPSVYLDLLPLPRDMKDQLKEYAMMQSQLALQQQQAQLAQTQQTIAQATEADRVKNMVDMKRIEEERRHNFASEIVQAVKTGFEHQRGMADVIAKASSEEMGMIQKVLEIVARMQEAKLGAVERGQAPGGGNGATG